MPISLNAVLVPPVAYNQYFWRDKLNQPISREQFTEYYKEYTVSSQWCMLGAIVPCISFFMSSFLIVPTIFSFIFSSTGLYNEIENQKFNIQVQMQYEQQKAEQRMIAEKKKRGEDVYRNEGERVYQSYVEQMRQQGKIPDKTS